MRAGNRARRETQSHARRLIETSQGHLILEVHGYSAGDTSVDAERFDAEGWQNGRRWWFSSWGGYVERQTLRDFLIQFANLPELEANELADEILSDWVERWRSRGGVAHARWVSRASLLLLLAVAIAATLALFGLVMLVWLLAS